MHSQRKSNFLLSVKSVGVLNDGKMVGSSVVSSSASSDIASGFVNLIGGLDSLSPVGRGNSLVASKPVVQLMGEEIDF